MKINLPYTLLRQTIYPVFFVLVAKFSAVFLLTKAFNFEYLFTSQGVTFSSYGDFLKVNSYSSLIMLFVVFIGLLWSVLQANFFHATHLSPILSSRLADFGVTSLVKPSHHVFTSASVWLALSWLCAGDFLFESYLGLVVPWLFWVSFALALIFTWAILSDFEKEMDLEEVVEITVKTANETF